MKVEETSVTLIEEKEYLVKSLEEEKSNHSNAIHESIMLKSQLEDFKLKVEQLKCNRASKDEIEGLKKTEKSLRDIVQDKMNIISQLNAAIEEVENNLEEVFQEKNDLQLKIDSLLTEQKALKEQAGHSNHLSCEEKEREANEKIKALELERDEFQTELNRALDKEILLEELEASNLELMTRLDEMTLCIEDRFKQYQETINEHKAESRDLNELLQSKSMELVRSGRELEKKIIELKEQMQEAETKVITFREKTKVLEKDNEEMVSQLQTAKKDLCESLDKHEQIARLVKLEKDRVAELEEQLKMAVANSENLQALAKDKEEIVSQLELTRCELNNRLENEEQLKVENRRLKDRIRVVEDEAKEMEIEMKQLDLLQKEHQALKEFVDSAKQKLEEFNKMEKKLRETEEMVSQLQTAAKDGECCEKELHELKNHVLRLQSDLHDATQRKTELEDKDQLIENLKKDLRESLDKLEQIAGLAELEKDIRDRFAELEEQLKAAVANAENLQEQKEALMKDKEQIVSQLELTRCELNQHLENKEQLKVENRRLKDRIQGIEDEAKEMEMELKQLDLLQKEHQALKEFVDSAKQKLEEFNKMEEKLWETEEMVHQLQTAAKDGECCEKELHELKNHVLHLQMDLQDAMQRNTKLEDNEQLVEKLKDEITKLNTTIECLNMEKDNLCLRIEVERLKEENHALQKNIENFENEKLASKATIDELNLRIRDETERYRSGDDCIKKLQDDLEQRNVLSLELETRIENLKIMYEEKCSQCQELREESESRVKDLVTRIATSEIELETLKTGMSEKETQLAEYEEKGDEWQRREAQLLSEIQEFEVIRRELVEIKSRKEFGEKDSNEIQELKEQVKDLQRNLEEETKERDTSISTIKDLRSELDNLTLEREQSRDDCNSKVLELKNGLRKLKSDIEAKIRKALDLKEEDLRQARNRATDLESQMRAKEVESKTAVVGLLEKIRGLDQLLAEKSSVVNQVVEKVDTSERRILELEEKLKKVKEGNISSAGSAKNTKKV